MKSLRSLLVAVVVFLAVAGGDLFAIEGSFEPISDEILDSKPMRALYSVPSKVWVESIGTLGRPASEVWAYLAFESAGTTVSIFTGTLGAKVTKDVLCKVAENYVNSSPKDVCKELASSMMDVGLEAYRRNYPRYKVWKKSGMMSKADRMAFMKDNYTSNYLGFGKDLWADVMNYKYKQGKYFSGEATKESLLKEIVSLNESASTTVEVFDKLKVIVGLARSESLKDYAPYNDHLERIKAFEDREDVKFSLANREEVGSVRTQDMYEFGKMVFDMVKNNDRELLRRLVTMTESDIDDFAFWCSAEEVVERKDDDAGRFLKSTYNLSKENKGKMISLLSVKDKSEVLEYERGFREYWLSKFDSNTGNRSLAELIAESKYEKISRALDQLLDNAVELGIDFKNAKFSYCFFKSPGGFYIVFNAGSEVYSFAFDAAWLSDGWLLPDDFHSHISSDVEEIKRRESKALVVAKKPSHPQQIKKKRGTEPITSIFEESGTRTIAVDSDKDPKKSSQYLQVKNASREEMKGISATLVKLSQAQFNAFDVEFLRLIWLKAEDNNVLIKVVRTKKLSNRELIDSAKDAAFYDWNLRVLKEEGIMSWRQIQNIMNRNTRKGMKRP